MRTVDGQTIVKHGNPRRVYVAGLRALQPAGGL